MQPPEARAALAFDVGGTTIKAEVLNEELGVLARATAPTPEGRDLVATLADLGRATLETLDPSARDSVSRVGLVVPGLVDVDRGVSIFAANLGLRDAPLAEPLAELLGLPVTLGHDVTAAAEAERRLGAAAGLADPVIVIIGTGIAAVSYAHGRRVTGAVGQAGELGHVVVRPDGPPCGCGARGCLEAVASASAIARAYEARTGRPVAGALAVVEKLGVEPAADDVWREATAALADGLRSVLALLAPGAVVLGGGLAEAGDVLLRPVRAQLESCAHPMTVPPLLTARLGARAGVVGAALLALEGPEVT